MGTRHLIAVQKNGEYKIAQYGQWDGYPSGQGVRVLQFLRDMDAEVFKRNLDTTRFIDEDELTERWRDVGADDSGFVSLDISDKFRAKYPENSRDTGAGILDLVAEKQGLGLYNHIDFAQDSLFCEWAYVVDLDNNTFEVFEGFNRHEVTEGRFAGPKESGHDKSYGPVRLAHRWPLGSLPTDEAFLAVLVPQEQDEQEVRSA